MELWRVVGAVIVGIGGLLLVLVAMAQARDGAALRYRRGGRGPMGAAVLRTALVGLALLGVTIVAVLTLLPQFVIWTMSAMIWLILGVLILAD